MCKVILYSVILFLLKVQDVIVKSNQQMAVLRYNDDLSSRRRRRSRRRKNVKKSDETRVSGNMSTLAKLQSLNGLFAIYKKQGPTSADVLNTLKETLLKGSTAGQHQEIRPLSFVGADGKIFCVVYLFRSR